MANKEIAQRPGRSTGIAHGERKGAPAGEPAEFDDWGRNGCEAHHLGGGPNDERLGVAWDDDHSVSKLNDALEAVLSKDDGDAEIVHEPLECGEHLLGRPWVERGGRLVEDEDLGMGGEDSADRHALLLPGR